MTSSYSVCNVLIFFAFCFYPSDPYVKFAFRLFQGQIADCIKCIKFELRFFKLASPGTTRLK